MTQSEFLQAALVICMAAVIVMALVPPPEKKPRPQKRRYTQKELQHEAAHKGFGFRDSDPDRFFCYDDTCPRNRP